MRPQKMLPSLLFVVLFLISFQGISFWIQTMYPELMTCNAGGPFGIPLVSWIIIPSVISIIGFFFFIWWKQKESFRSFFWLILIAGGISNAGERFFFGCVSDYIHLPLGLVGNVADIALTVSVVFLLWGEIRKKQVIS